MDQLKYNKEKFVNRESETKEFRDKLLQLTSGRPIEKRTIAIVGERGIGKSWLLARLQEIAKEDEGNKIIIEIDIDSYRGRDPILSVIEILGSFAPQLPQAPKNLGTTPAEISRRLMEKVRQLLQKTPMIVFVDHVYESDWQLLAGLEDYLFWPLAIEPNVLIVLAGRGKKYPWKARELSYKAQFQNLKTFSVEDTNTQLEKQISHSAAEKSKEVWQISKGNPLGNYLLGKESPEKALDTMIAAILEIVPENSRAKLQEYLEALSVLRAFDEERIPIIFAAYYDNDKYKDWTYTQSREVIDTLVKQSFAQWSDEKEGFVIDDVVRNIFEQYVKENHRARWKKLHRAAEQLFIAWENDYDDDWKEEINHHQEALQLA